MWPQFSEPLRSPLPAQPPPRTPEFQTRPKCLSEAGLTPGYYRADTASARSVRSCQVISGRLGVTAWRSTSNRAQPSARISDASAFEALAPLAAKAGANFHRDIQPHHTPNLYHLHDLHCCSLAMP